MPTATKERDHEKYILRFEQPGHRDRLKEIAAREKRSLNKQILLFIEAGEAAAKAHDRRTAKQQLKGDEGNT